MPMRRSEQRIVRELKLRHLRPWLGAAAICIASIGILPAVLAQTLDVPGSLAQCQDERSEPAMRLVACSAIIEVKSIDQDLRIEALMNRGIIREGRGEGEAAIDDYSIIITMDPTNALAHYNRGNAHGRLGRTDQALTDYDKAIELDPKDPDFYTNRGLSRAEAGDHSKAVADFDNAIALGATDASIFSARGLSNEKLGRITQALADYRKALELDNDDDAQEGLERLSAR